MPLFTATDLTSWLQYPVTESEATIAEKVVAGWISDATGSVVLPDPLPSQMFSWALELGGLAHENPGAMFSETTGDKTTQWDRARRAEILRSVAAWAGNTAGGYGTPRPRGSFPKARPWPDPVERC